MIKEFDKLIAALSKKFKKGEIKKGIKVEREHDDITKGNPKLVGKIVAAHLKELPDYYTKLQKMEKRRLDPKQFPVFNNPVHIMFFLLQNIFFNCIQFIVFSFKVFITS